MYHERVEIRVHKVNLRRCRNPDGQSEPNSARSPLERSEPDVPKNQPYKVNLTLLEPN